MNFQKVNDREPTPGQRSRRGEEKLRSLLVLAYKVIKLICLSMHNADIDIKALALCTFQFAIIKENVRIYV